MLALAIVWRVRFNFVGLQPTVIASRASPPLLEQSSSTIQRIVDARRPSTSIDRRCASRKCVSTLSARASRLSTYNASHEGLTTYSDNAGSYAARLGLFTTLQSSTATCFTLRVLKTYFAFGVLSDVVRHSFGANGFT